ncbi:MAG: serine protease [Candidatus Buchananbacteria bacterium]|nr:serine protease [Candidatus Buchananbacteria bacterium]
MIKKILDKKNSQISQVVILSMIFGFGSGVVGQIVADVYIDPWRQDYITQGIYDNTTDVPEIPQLRRVERFLGIEQDFEVNKSITKVNSALVGIYKKKAVSGQAALNQVYTAADLVANGVALTSDGWLATHQKALADFDLKNLVVIFNHQLFEVKQMVQDETTGVAFIKISADNLGIVTLGDSRESTLGQLGVVTNVLGEVTVVNVKDNDYRQLSTPQEYVFSSERYDYSLLISKGLDSNYLGSPVVNLGGEVIGIVYEIRDDGQALAVPINQFKSIILDVLRSNTVNRPLLGVMYVDLSKVVGLNVANGKDLSRGALIYQSPNRNTPAFSAGFKEGDIILSIDGQLVDENSNLTELIQQYQVGDEVSIEYLRSGVTATVDVVLSAAVQ